MNFAAQILLVVSIYLCALSLRGIENGLKEIVEHIKKSNR